MRKQWKKRFLLGGLAVMTAAMAGCYGYGYGSYGNSASRIPKTTAARDALEEFDVAGLKNANGAFQFQGLAWGASKEEAAEYFGMPVETDVTFNDGSSYADLNYSILLLDKISVGLMPVFDENGGLNCVSIYFENTYSAEALDTFYKEAVALCTVNFGEPDEVKPETRESNGSTMECETTIWYHEISETNMTTLQIAKLDSGSGTDAVIMGVNTYDPTTLEEETTEDGTADEETADTEAESASQEETAKTIAVIE